MLNFFVSVTACPRLLIMADDSSCVRRLSHKTRKVRSALGKTPWRARVRAKHQNKARTPADVTRKTRMAERRKEKAQAIADARTEIKKLAEVLHEKFGDNTVDHYLKTLVQAVRAPKGTRKVSTWNAFVSLQTKRMNDGMYSHDTLTAY